MIIKFDMFKDGVEHAVLYLQENEEDVDSTIDYILARLMDFRTHCIKEHLDPNVYYFKNWIRKYYAVEFIEKGEQAVVRVDF